MRRIITLILTLIFVFTLVGCAQETTTQKTEEELKSEIKAEMEAEAKLKEDLKVEIKKELEEEQKTKDTKKTNEDNTLLINGRIISNGIPMGIGILLDEKLIVNGKEVTEVYFDEDIITDLIPRIYMTYYIEGGTSLKEELNKELSIQVKIDTNSYDYYSDLNRTSAKIVEIISLDGETSPVNKTNDEYSLDYYKTVFYTWVYEVDSPCTSNIKEHTFYKNTNDPVVGDDFKIAVDKILENGLFIQMAEGEYMINETEKKYSDGEIEAPTVFNIENLKNADKISGDMIINNIEYTKGSDRIKFDLIGGTLVFGNVTYDDYYEGYILIVDDPYLFNSEIKISLSESYTFNYKPGVLFIRNENFISDEYKQALKQGKKLDGKISIKDISFSAKDGSESGESCELTDFLDVTLTD